MLPQFLGGCHSDRGLVDRMTGLDLAIFFLRRLMSNTTTAEMIREKIGMISSCPMVGPPCIPNVMLDEARFCVTTIR